MNRFDLTDIYKTPHPARVECTFFSIEKNKIDYISGFKTSHNKFKRIKITQNMFCNYNGIQLEINSKKTFVKHIYEEIKQHITKYPMGERRIKKGNYKILWNEWKCRYNILKLMKRS